MSKSEEMATVDVIKSSIKAFEAADKEGLEGSLTGIELERVRKLSAQELSTRSNKARSEHGTMQAVSIKDVITSTPQLRTVRVSVKYTLRLEGAIAIYDLKPDGSVWKIAEVETLS